MINTLGPDKIVLLLLTLGVDHLKIDLAHDWSNLTRPTDISFLAHYKGL